jgi:hypothetical protein
MIAMFRLDGCYTLRIGEDEPRTMSTPGSVGLQITYDKLTLPPDSPAPTEIIAAFSLRRSQARAIASAMLSAATESKVD